jgi:RNA polymerase sigma-70 factor (ECF subfamily)
MAYFLCHDKNLSDDLSQEVLLKAFNALASVDEASFQPKPWLFAILRNSWRDRVRHHAARTEASLDGIPEEPADDRRVEDHAFDATSVLERGVDVLIEEFSDVQVIRALQELPDEIRWTLLLWDVEGLNINDVASLLDVPAGTIKSRAHRGRRMLRGTLARYAREHGLLKEERQAQTTENNNDERQ